MSVCVCVCVCGCECVRVCVCVCVCVSHVASPSEKRCWCLCVSVSNVLPHPIVGCVGVMEVVEVDVRTPWCFGRVM